MRLSIKAALIMGVLTVSGCASLNDTERAFLGGGAGLLVAGPLGVSPAVSAAVGAGVGLFSDNILGY